MAGREELVLPPINNRKHLSLPSLQVNTIPEPKGRRVCAPIDQSSHVRLTRTFTLAGLSPPPCDRPIGSTPATNPPKRRPLTDKNDKLYLLRTKYSMAATAGPSSSPARDLFASPEKPELRRRTLSPLRSAPPTFEQRPLVEIVPPEQFGGCSAAQPVVRKEKEREKDRVPLSEPVGQRTSPLASPHRQAEVPEIEQDEADLPPSAFGEAAGEGLGANTLIPCPTCQRSFAADRLEVHQRICQKVAKNAATRGVYRRPPAAVPGSSAPPAVAGVPPRQHPAKRQNLRREPPRTPAGEDAGDVPKTVRWLQQRSAEIEFTLRLEIRSEDDLLQAVRTLQTLEPFLERLEGCVVPRCGFAKDLIFQELLSRLQRDTEFDAQHGAAGVPMHQAKVLVRAERLAGVGEALERAFAPTEIAEMVAAADSLRRLLRIKVEDANDLRMAQAAIKDANAFVSVLQRHASANGDDLFTAYQKLL